MSLLVAALPPQTRSLSAPQAGSSNQESRFYELMRNTEVLTMVFDPENSGVATFQNLAAEVFYEKSSSEGENEKKGNSLRLMDVVDSCVFDTSQMRADVIRAVTSLTLNSERYEVEARKRHSLSRYEQIDDLTCWHRIVFQPITDSGRLAVLVNEYDITELKKVQLDLAVTNKTQEQFFATVTHELRTPLNAIIGLSESLLHDAVLMQGHQGAQAMKNITVIKNSGKHLAGLVNDILDLASIKRQTLVLRDDDVEIAEIARNVCDMLNSMCRPGVKLINNIDSQLPLVPGDSGRIKQIFTNLVNNATKFTEKGTIVLSAQVVKDWVRVEVEDTGIGIPEEKLNDIWGAFKQVDMSTTRKFGGTGLGLSVVQALVEAHNGKIEVKSRHKGPETGTVFAFYLPLVREFSRAESGDEASQKSEGLGSPTTRGRTELTSQGLVKAANMLRESVSSKSVEESQHHRSSDLWDHQSQPLGEEQYWRDLVLGASRILAEGSGKANLGKFKEADFFRRIKELRAAEYQSKKLKEQVKALQEQLQLMETKLTKNCFPNRQDEEDTTPKQRKQRPSLNGFSGAAKIHSQIHGSFEVLCLLNDKLSSQLVANSLEPKGFRVSNFTDSLEALGTLESRGFLPDLLLADCQIEGPGGSDICSLLESHYPCNHIPSLMVSSSNQDLGNLTPGIGLLTKPLDPEELVSRVQAQLRDSAERSINQWVRERFGKADVLNGTLADDPQKTSQDLVLFDSAVAMICEVRGLFGHETQTLNPKRSENIALCDVAQIYEKVYRAFDKVVLKLEDMNAVRQVGDCYLVILANPAEQHGSPKHSQSECEHSEAALELANSLMAQFEGMDFSEYAPEGLTPKLIIGLSMGPVCGAMVGMRKPNLSYFGPAIKQACMVCDSVPNKNIYATEDFVSSLEPSKAASFMQFRTITDGELEIGSQLHKGWDSETALDWMDEQGELVSVSSDTHDREDRFRGTERQGRSERVNGSAASPRQPSVESLPNNAEFEIAKQNWRNSRFSSSTGMIEGVSPLNGRGVWEGSTNKDTTAEAVTQKMTKILDIEAVDQPHLSKWKTPSSRNKNSLETIRKVNGDVTILSVDDDPINQMVIENLVAPMGYKIEKCMSGFEAVEYMGARQEHLPDVILLDVMMPGMSGFEFCRIMREQYSSTQLPIIMVSAKNDEVSLVEGLEDGCNDYVSKPFSRLELLARISTQLRLKHAWETEIENARSTRLLQRMLPEHVISKLKNDPSLIVEEHKNVTVLFSDIVGYTTMASQLPALELIQMLNDMVCVFDELLDKHGCYKVQLIGDGYMVVSGHDGRTDHAPRMLRLALDMVNAVKAIPMPRKPGKHVAVRIGVHSGPAVAGILGTKMPRYCFFGDTVNTAARMESHGYPNNVHVSESVAQMAQEQSQFRFQAMGERQIKGKGSMSTFLLQDTRCDIEEALQQAYQESVESPAIRRHPPEVHVAVTCPSDANYMSGNDEISDEPESKSEAFRQSAEAAFNRQRSPPTIPSHDADSALKTVAAAGRETLSLSQRRKGNSRSSSPDPGRSPTRGGPLSSCSQCAESAERERVAIERERQANDRAAVSAEREYQALIREREANDRLWQTNQRERDSMRRESQNWKTAARPGFNSEGPRSLGGDGQGGTQGEDSHVAASDTFVTRGSPTADSPHVQAGAAGRESVEKEEDVPSLRQSRTLRPMSPSTSSRGVPTFEWYQGQTNHGFDPEQRSPVYRATRRNTGSARSSSPSTPSILFQHLGDQPVEDKVVKILLERDALSIQRDALNNSLHQTLFEQFLAEKQPSQPHSNPPESQPPQQHPAAPES